MCATPLKCIYLGVSTYKHLPFIQVASYFSFVEKMSVSRLREREREKERKGERLYLSAGQK